MSEPLPDWLVPELPPSNKRPTWPVRGVRREIAEGHELVAYVRAYLEPAGEGAHARPGLRSGGVSPTFVEETTWLLDRLAADAERIAQPLQGYPLARAREVMRELRACLGWVARRDPDTAARLKGWAAKHPKRRRAFYHRGALRELALAARLEADALAAVPGIDPGLLDEATALGAWEDGGAQLARAWLLDAACGLLAVLRARTRDVVEIADFVFRHHPELARAARPRRLLEARAAAGRSRRRKRGGNG